LDNGHVEHVICQCSAFWQQWSFNAKIIAILDNQYYPSYK
jgi:hypothetical protein